MAGGRIYSTQAGAEEENPAEHVPVPLRRNIHLVRAFAAAALRRARDGICGDIPLLLAMTRLLGEKKAPQKRNQRERRARLLSEQGQNEEKKRLFFSFFFPCSFFPLFGGDRIFLQGTQGPGRLNDQSSLPLFPPAPFSLSRRSLSLPFSLDAIGRCGMQPPLIQ